MPRASARDQNGWRHGDRSVLVLEDFVVGEIREHPVRRAGMPAIVQLGVLTSAKLVDELAEVGTSAGHAGTRSESRRDLQAATIRSGEDALWLGQKRFHRDPDVARSHGEVAFSPAKVINAIPGVTKNACKQR